MRTEIICILDRSGSMSGLESDTIGGFNAFIEEQKKLDDECKVTTILFDHGYDVLYEARDLKEVPVMTDVSYFVRGSTALLDAIGRAANTAGARYASMPKDKQPEKVIVLIITDGYENCSREFSNEDIRAIIEHQEGKYSWEFTYLGANQDAFAVAHKTWGMKTSNIANYSATTRGTASAYNGFAAKTMSLRTGHSAAAFNLSDVVETDESSISGKALGKTISRA